ncbi:MAG TPA: iron ABC transporter substrate-binding protein [Jiangellaceae bacterium]
MRPLSLSTALVAAALVLTACGGDDDAGAVDESKLVLYSGRAESLVQPVIDQFEEATGTEVSVRYGSTSQLAAQLVEEGERSPADVFFGQDAGALGALTNAELLAPLPTDVLDVVDERFRAEDGTWVGTSGRARVIAYNGDALDESAVPDSVFDLTSPEWNGRVGIAPGNASFQAFVTAMRVLEGDDVARQWLDAMADNGVERFDNNVLVLDAVDEGVVDVGLINHYYWYERVAEQGQDAVTARLKFLPGDDPGSLINVAGAGVLAGSDRGEEAARFVEFLLGEQAQSYFADETKEYPLRPGITVTEGLPPLESLDSPAIDLSDLDSLEETLKMIEEAGLT